MSLRYPLSQQQQLGGTGAVSEEQAQVDELVNQYQKTSSEDKLYKLMEQENERSGMSSYQQNGESSTGGGRRDYLSSAEQQQQQQQQQFQQYGDTQQQSLRDLQQQQELRQTQEFTSPLMDQQESAEPSWRGAGDASMTSSRRGDISPEERQDPFTTLRGGGEESTSYPEAGGSEMNSFLRGQEQGAAGLDGAEESSYYSSESHPHRRHHKHHSDGDISDRELISKLLDMLRDKEHAKDVAQSELSFNFQRHPDQKYFMPEQNTFNPIQPQQQQSEFPGTGRSSFPQNPSPEYPSSSFAPSQDSPEVPQAENLLSSLIQNLERSNSIQYSPPINSDQQSFYQQPSPQSFFQQHEQPASFPAPEGFGRQAFQNSPSFSPSPSVIQNTFTQFQPQPQQQSLSGLSNLLGGNTGNGG